jgi:hypothetical protein
MLVAATVTNASEQYACARARSAHREGSSSANADATYLAADSADSASSSMSAHMCLTAWKLPIARPN